MAKSSLSSRLLGSAHPITVLDPIMLETELSSLDDARDDNYNKTSNMSVQMPIERTIPRCHSAGCIEGQVERLGSNEYQRRYLMSLQIEEGRKHPLFIAEKEQSSRTVVTGNVTRYIIREFRDDSVLGTLTKSGGARDPSVCYTLTHRNSQCPVAYIRYEVPSVLQVLTESPPRRAFIEIPRCGSVETKEPGSKGGGGTNKALNFRGRGREASRKNMQLHNRDGRVVLQFVKWGDVLFHLDFA